jgi:hypothetical protein
MEEDLEQMWGKFSLTEAEGERVEVQEDTIE